MLTLLALVLAQQPGPLPAGSWRGYYAVPSMAWPVVVTVAADGAATLQTAFDDTTRSVVRITSAPDGQVRIAVPSRGDSVVLTAPAHDRVLRGTVTQGAARGDFVLRRVEPLTDAEVVALSGEYRLADGSVFLVTGGRAAYEGAGFMDWKTGRVGRLFAEGRGRFVGGPGRFVPHPVVLTVRFPGGDAIEVEREGAPAVRGHRIPVPREEEVAFPSGAARLAGTLTLPAAGAGPYPAVVLLHGSDPHTRFRGEIVSFFASRGVAVLTWDKRGNGGSTGTLVGVVDSMAADAEAAIRFLRSRPGIDPRRIGVWGISQGGWPASVVASRDPSLAFVILHAGAFVTPAEQGVDEMRSLVINGGGTAQDVETGIAYQRLYQAVIRGTTPREELEARYRALREAGYRFAWSPAAVESPSARFFSGMMDFDPAPYWARSRVPLLAFFGEFDPLVPPESNLGPLRASGVRAEVVVLPRANHRFEEVERLTTNRIYAIAGRYVPEYFERMGTWLEGVLR